MDLQTVRNLLSQRPFQPFQVVMAKGQKLDVPVRDTVFLTRDSIVVGIDIGDDGVPGDFRICALAQVATIEPLNGTT